MKLKRDWMSPFCLHQRSLWNVSLKTNTSVLPGTELILHHPLLQSNLRQPTQTLSCEISFFFKTVGKKLNGVNLGRCNRKWIRHFTRITWLRYFSDRLELWRWVTSWMWLSQSVSSLYCCMNSVKETFVLPSTSSDSHDRSLSVDCKTSNSNLVNSSRDKNSNKMVKSAFSTSPVSFRQTGGRKTVQNWSDPAFRLGWFYFFIFFQTVFGCVT